MIKILHLSKFYPPIQGGIETFLFDLNECIFKYHKKNIQSDVLSFNDTINSVKDNSRGYLIQRSGMILSISRMPISLNYISWLINNASKYDVIHLHYPNPFADLALFLSKYKGKLVVHWHSDIVKQKITDLVYSPLRIWLLNKANKIIATSPNYAQGSKFLRRYKNKVEIIPLGFNHKRLSFADKSRVNEIVDKYENRKIIFSLGRQVYYKGFEYLIKSAKHLDNSYVILIAGKGELFDYHQNLIKSLDLADKVKMLGFLSDDELSNYYEACSIFAMSSIKKSEAFGVVQLEAMSFGKPLVSTSIKDSGVGWVNKNGYSGIVVPVKDDLAIARAFELIMNNNRNDYSTKSKKRFDENFKINIITEKIVNMYLDL